jgi:hypothetical protein
MSMDFAARRSARFVAPLTLAVALAFPAGLAAQYGAVPGGDLAIGETYRVELTAGLWNPTPDMVVSSPALGIAGTDIDVVDDLGVVRKRFGEFKAVLRPGRQHKFRFQYIPMSYDASTTIRRDLVFNGATYRVGLPVSSALDWKSYRVGYEYDFFYRDRGFIGVLADVKYTDVRVELDSPLGLEFARARGPLPAIGVIGRGYVVRMASVTGEVTLFNLFGSLGDDYEGRYLDYDVYGTVNFTDHLGSQVGYRSIDVHYDAKGDTGTLKLGGLYFSGVLRF